MLEDVSLQQRLLQATESLVYAGGINATGMDAIVKASGVARKSIYRLYPTKEMLVAAALRARDERWMQWFIAGTSAGSSSERLLAVFPLLRSWFCAPDFHGCAFINAAGEVGDPDSEIRAVALLHKQRLLAYLNELTTACGFADPEEMARQFLLLIDGATAVAMVTGQADAADSAGRTAQLLLQTLSPSDGLNPPQA
ncbi:TetR/AcrR family transcriptional regulator [Pseudomonas sp. MDMC216]|nr:MULTISPECIES: TetR/AcrR family transcriptional regulator [Pseudomonas]MBA4682037.1 TetR/AcrR family transcriptional regulator [Pseudomonas sp.]MDH1558111.1 TetR/AcrR family transcriptional regulator [Pseudomonas chengduensis]MDI5995893.1 TetR/AcrR family transcriptional regulator [Pseudomonas sp. MDMC216]MDI6007445.1 TetR/AcrR family transcriptional regulator [Pseudomonas sp. MDMC17]RAR30399.1 TetR/AcrR family transcriptional regulator [Pseudomonas sp. MDMC224]